MPNEFDDLVKAKEEKKMPEEEYRKIYDEYNLKAENLSKKVQTFIFISLAVLLASYILINIVGATLEMDFKLLAVEFFIIAIFLYDPKIEEDKRYQYESNQQILLNSIKGKIKLSKIRLGFVIFFTSVFVLLNVIFWYIISIGLSDTQI